MDIQSLDHLRLIGVRTVGLIMLAMILLVFGMTCALSPGDVGLVSIAMAAFSLLPLLFAWQGRADTTARLAFGLAVPLFPAVLLFVMRGHDWQMDLHMTFFAAVAILLLLCDWRPILAATLVTVVHHLATSFLIPSFTFNTSSNLDRVLLHAVILLVASGVSMLLASRLAALVEAVVMRNAQMLAAEEARRTIEAARLDEQRAYADQQQRIMRELQAALAAIARGDLRYRIVDMPEAFASLKSDFNNSAASLSAMIGLVAATTRNVGTETLAISQSSHQLAQHSESQAAIVQEATGALSHLAGDVTSIADRARQAAERMGRMEADSSRGGEMATLMRDAMADVVSATNQIAAIVEVIDKIAFQTNLLALNAGVEAARAGDAGHGFAVVAHEVRALSERTAQAAKEVHKLIDRAQKLLDVGVDHVNGSAAVLDGLSNSISGIGQLMQEIVSATGNQSAGLKSVNAAVEEINHATRRTATMAEESDAAVDRLKQKTDRLADYVEHYAVDDHAKDPHRARRDLRAA